MNIQRWTVTIALSCLIPSLVATLCAQQAAPSGNTAQASPQPSQDASSQPIGQYPSAHDELPPEFVPGIL